MPLQPTATEVCISIESRPEHLPRLRTIVGCLAADLGMSNEEAQDTKLAITEACANAIRHGSPKGTDSGVLIKLVAGPRRMVVEVTDEGEGFDVDEVSATERPEKSGGLGIPLMRALSDGVEFLRNGKGMTVRLVKKVRARSTRRQVAPRKRSR